MEIFKEFSIETAHYLPNLPVGHKCRRLHGHSFRIGVYVSGDCDPESGWVMDFADLATGGAETIVTSNVRDFKGAELRFTGLRVLRPEDLIAE